jgi:hypothetical protein
MRRRTAAPGTPSTLNIMLKDAPFADAKGSSRLSKVSVRAKRQFHDAAVCEQ